MTQGMTADARPKRTGCFGVASSDENLRGRTAHPCARMQLRTPQLAHSQHRTAGGGAGADGEECVGQART